ncbi:MAG: MOSC domain-containing protein YiiM [Candidatus Paceibacteria bacterium]|jgi:MOSC domain-containing protein YiiM
MDFSWRFDSWFTGLPESPTDEGHVCALVIRPPEGGSGARERVESIEVSVERGVQGDRWATDEERTGQDQISLVNIHVLESLAGKDPDRCALSGDNLHVDLDLTEANLPVGTQLFIGTATLEVSTQAHIPCGKFLDRYGATAVKKVLRANRKGRRGRGVICMVAQSGTIRAGDKIKLQRPGA